MSVPARPRPLVAVVFCVPLFVEALLAAFEGLADVQPLTAADAELAGLLGALSPNAVVVEAPEGPVLTVDVPLIHIDLERRVVRSRSEGGWIPHEIDLSGEAIRNVVLAAMFAGAEG